MLDSLIAQQDIFDMVQDLHLAVDVLLLLSISDSAFVKSLARDFCAGRWGPVGEDDLQTPERMAEYLAERFCEHKGAA